MYLPSPRQIDAFETLAPQIEALVFEWLDRVDRREPVPPEAVRAANELLVDARRLMSRAPRAHHVAPVPGHGPVMPGELFVALLKAMVAVRAFAERYSRKTREGRLWFTPDGHRCPLCRTSLKQS